MKTAVGSGSLRGVRGEFARHGIEINEDQARVIAETAIGYAVIGIGGDFVSALIGFVLSERSRNEQKR